MDKISIITANYNRSALLEKAILSIANQKSTNSFTREMIIVDDGSTDNSIDVINKYSKKYPQNIRLFSQKN
ncbi:glycosyltransferase [Patescibacteria group bacterium]|nr:glycosyltransferase [Patescibacteria group bacterium]